jgi:hypothetical protein
MVSKGVRYTDASGNSRRSSSPTSSPSPTATSGKGGRGFGHPPEHADSQDDGIPAEAQCLAPCGTCGVAQVVRVH